MEKYLLEEAEDILKDKEKRGKMLKLLDCTHQGLIKSYQLGIFNTYICLDCGLKSLDRNDFK